MSRLFIQKSLISLSLFLPGLLFAAEVPPTKVTSPPAVPGIGGIAGNLLEPVSILTDFVTSISLIIGVMFMFVAFMKYMQHRKNPLAVPINNVVFLVIFGVILILLPLSYKLDVETPPTSVVDTKK